MHLYMSHMGGYYVEEEYDEELLEPCEQCWDWDSYVGEYDTMEEIALELYRRNSSDEHILEVTGLKVSFEESDE